MININDIKNGMTIIYEGNACQIVEFQHVKPGKGSAFVRTKLKNLKTNSTIEVTFNAGIKVEKANVEKNEVSYLYKEGDRYTFMDNKTYDQITLDSELLKDKVKFLKEGLNIFLYKFDNKIIDIELPEKVSYKVISTEPSIKGNTVSNALKDATLETNLVIKVPLFIETGEEVVVTTNDGKYSSRA